MSIKITTGTSPASATAVGSVAGNQLRAEASGTVEARNINTDSESSTDIRHSQDSTNAAPSEGGVSPAVATLQKRIKELEKQLQDQQQQLQQVSSKKYASDTEKTTAVMGAQSLVAATSAALSEASSQLAEALSKDPIRTTA
ncbi:hypothetical protein [Pseudomonas sp. NPDC088444]|uniref:hypothetical protein n=1 Tax=Pseudomonas sp. NPDC088444 TaxID=3364456 RepID=UPI00384D18C3